MEAFETGLKLRHPERIRQCAVMHKCCWLLAAGLFYFSHAVMDFEIPKLRLKHGLGIMSSQCIFNQQIL